MPKSREKSREALYALQNPPSCIDAFDARPINKAGDHSEVVRFELSCKKCRQSQFRIHCDPHVVTSESTWKQFPVGYVVELPPYRAECASCGELQLVFDATKHGYDGAYADENADFVSRGDGVEKPIACDQPNYRVEVLFGYGIDLKELEEIEQESGVKVQDLFDWFKIFAVGPDGRELKELDYECA